MAERGARLHSKQRPTLYVVLSISKSSPEVETKWEFSRSAVLLALLSVRIKAAAVSSASPFLLFFFFLSFLILQCLQLGFLRKAAWKPLLVGVTLLKAMEKTPLLDRSPDVLHLALLLSSSEQRCWQSCRRLRTTAKKLAGAALWICLPHRHGAHGWCTAPCGCCHIPQVSLPNPFPEHRSLPSRPCS